MSKYPNTAELEALPTLESAHTDDLKLQGGPIGKYAAVKLWLSRCALADGEPFENTATVEARTETGPWETLAVYSADDAPETVDGYTLAELFGPEAAHLVFCAGYYAHDDVRDLAHVVAAGVKWAVPELVHEACDGDEAVARQLVTWARNEREAVAR